MLLDKQVLIIGIAVSDFYEYHVIKSKIKEEFVSKFVI